MTVLRIELLDGFRVTVGTRQVPDDAWHRRKPAALLKLLALAPGHRLHRERAEDALWPDLDPAAAAANLRKALFHLRQALDPDGASIVVSAGDHVALRPDELWVDVEAYDRLVAQARATKDRDTYAEAIALYGGGLLPEDRYDSWASDRHETLRAEFGAVLDEHAALLEAEGALDDAIRVMRRLVAMEPLHEDFHLRLVRLHALAGQRPEAMKQYEQLRDALRSELGVEPSAAAQRLYEEVRSRQAAEPELTAELWERVGELRVLAGDTNGAVKGFESAIALGDPGSRARLHRKAAQAVLMQHDADGAEAYLTTAERLTTDAAERAHLACLRANQAWERGDFDAAHRFAEEGRALVATTGDDDAIAAVHETLAIVSHLRGDWRAGLETEVERLAEGSDSAVARVFDIHQCIGQYHLYGDGLADDVEDYARRALAVAEKAEAVRAQAFAWCLLGEALLLGARWDEAAGCLQRSCDLHGTFGSTSGALPWQRLAELAICRGAPKEAGMSLRSAAAIATVSPMARHVWGRIHATAALGHLELGDPEAATRSVNAAAAAAARYGDCPTCSALLNPLAAEAFASVGDPTTAAEYAAAAARVAAMFDSSAWRAMAESATASVAAANGDETGARGHAATASNLYERAHQPYWAQRALRT